jgi:hypothetical protein
MFKIVFQRTSFNQAAKYVIIVDHEEQTVFIAII